MKLKRGFLVVTIALGAAVLILTWFYSEYFLFYKEEIRNSKFAPQETAAENTSAQ